jgi:leukotriene-A4 hydrolase
VIPSTIEPMKVKNLCIAALVGVIGLSACNQTPKEEKETVMAIKDPHSYARPDEAKVKHLSLNVIVDFAAKTIGGKASYDIETSANATKIVFDTRDLQIYKVTLDDDQVTEFSIGESLKFLGAPLEVKITPTTKKVNIFYTSSPNAAALQWLSPEQTAGKKQPFLFTQSQAILARTWIPCQDSPGIRFSYDARVQVPKELMALMSAVNPTENNGTGIYNFKMEQPIPAYLMALAVGDIAFQAIDDRTAVYAEPSMLAKSAYEFEGMGEMLAAAEGLYGKYAWERYDVIVLPPSFPFGGMENPRLTFATPTILAGDQSLVSLIAHELAHSWSGNLVTNATWDDFWLNEGFTVYFERRIMEAVSGESYAEMLSSLGAQDLRHTVADMGPNNPDTKLHLQLEGRDPDEGLTEIAYEKGNFFLVNIEKAVGRETFDAFLKEYFAAHAFKTITTTQFIDYLNANLIKGDQALAEEIGVDRWIYEPGLPTDFPKIESERFMAVDKVIKEYKGGKAPAMLATKEWSTHEWLHFLRNLPEDISATQMAELDKAFSFTKTGNSEIACVWLTMAVDNQYAAAYPAVDKFLVTVGRRKFLVPLYKAMTQSEEGKLMALDIYTRARKNYHSVSTSTIDNMLGYNEVI